MVIYFSVKTNYPPSTWMYKRNKMRIMMNTMKFRLARYKILPLWLLLFSFIQASPAWAGNGANFVLYNHHTPKAGESEVMLMYDLGQEPDKTLYEAQMIEAEYGLTDYWTTEFMIEGQNTPSSGGQRNTGFRWENRLRLFDYGAFLNPVVYMEYEDLSEDTKYLMEMSGREDARTLQKKRPRERVFETRLILGEDISEHMDVSFNWINENDLDTGIIAYGYALGFNYAASERLTIGLELFGGIGDSDLGITTKREITQHYTAINFKTRFTENGFLKFGGAVGNTDVSQDLTRFSIGLNF